MQQIIISQELQQARSAIFGSYGRRQYNTPTDPEVNECKLYRHYNKKQVNSIKADIVERAIVAMDPYRFSFDYDEIIKFDDDDQNRESESSSSGFYDASDWSSSGSTRSSKSSFNVQVFQVLYFQYIHIL